MARDLPSLNAVRVFASAARLLSFTAAAEELSVTQGAVSRQIKLLEDQLGQPLFERAGPKLRLTSAGEYYLPVAGEALAILRRGTAQVRRSAARAVLTISVLPSFASNWLIPRLPDFEQRNPDVAVRLASDYLNIDFSTTVDIDVALRLGRGDWPDLYVRRFSHDQMFPVCTRSLARRLKTPRDLVKLRFLSAEAEFDEWPRWLKAAGVDLQPKQVREFTDSSILLRAATEGQGVTMARSGLVERELALGQLVRPFDQAVEAEAQFYFVCLPERLDEPDIRAFHDWIVSGFTGVAVHALP